MANFNSTKGLITALEKVRDLSIQVTKESEKMNTNISKAAKNAAESFKNIDFAKAAGIKEFNEQLEKSNKLVKVKVDNDKTAAVAERELIKTQKELTKALQEEEKLKQQKIQTAAKLTAEEVKAAKEKDRQIALTKKEIKATEILNAKKAKAAELAERQATVYAKLVKSTDEARIKYKLLAAEFGKNSKQAKKAHKEFSKYDKRLRDINDAAKDGYRDIGRYRIATEKLGRATKRLGGAGRAAGVGMAAAGASLIGFVAKALNTRSAGKSVRKVLSQLEAGFQLVVIAIAESIPHVIDIFKGLNGEVGLFFDGIQVSISKLMLSVNKALDSLSWGEFAKEVKESQSELNKAIELQKQHEEAVNKSRIAYDKIGDAFKKGWKNYEKTSESIEKVKESKDKLIDTTAKYVKIISDARQEEELNNAIEGEVAASLKDRIKATEEAIKANKRRTAAEVSLSLEIKKHVDLEIAADKARSKGVEGYLVSEELVNKLTAATVGLTEAQGEQATSLVDNRAKMTQLALDIFEQEADFVLDGYENQKTINERKLEDENLTLTEKKKILELEKKAQKQQVEDLNEIFNKSLKDLGFSDDEFDLIKQRVNFEKLLITLKEEGSDALLKEIQLLEASEIANKQIFDRVREINTQQQDQIDNQLTITEQSEEELKIKQQIVDQEKLLSGLDGDTVNKERRKARQLEIQKELDTLLLDGNEERTFKELELEQELNALKLLDFEELQADKDKLVSESEQLLELSKDKALELIDEISQAKQSALERDLAQNLKNQDIIQKGIDNGSKIGEQSLALEKKMQEDREKELKKLENKQLKLTAFIALMKVYGETGDLGKTIGAFATLKQEAGKVDGSFYEGTDSVGSTGSETYVHGGRDGYLAELDRGEMVIEAGRANELRALGYSSRESLTELARMASMGVDKGGSVIAVSNNNNAILENKTDEMIDLLKKLPNLIPVPSSRLSDNDTMMEHSIKRGNITETLKTKAHAKWVK